MTHPPTEDEGEGELELEDDADEEAAEDPYYREQPEYLPGEDDRDLFRETDPDDLVDMRDDEDDSWLYDDDDYEDLDDEEELL